MRLKKVKKSVLLQKRRILNGVLTGRMVCTIRKKFGRSVGENALQKMILWREAEKIRQGVKLIGLEKSTIMKLVFFVQIVGLQI